MATRKPRPSPEASESNMTLDNEPDDDFDDDGDAESMAFESFADASGIPEEKRAGAKSALEQFIRTCARSHGKEEY
jgi:hypothetical protein